MRIVITVSPECVPGLASPQQLPVCVGAGGLQAGVKLVVVNTGCNRAPVLRGGSYTGCLLYRVFVILGVIQQLVVANTLCTTMAPVF